MMMMGEKIKKVIVVMKHDLAFYPPIISICRNLIELNVEVVYVGYSSSKVIIEDLKTLGAKFYSVSEYKGNPLKRFFQQFKFQSEVKKVLKEEYSAGSAVWYAHFETALLFLNEIVSKNSIVHFVEYRDAKLNLGYKLITKFKDVKKVIGTANKVVCCEYNRSMITKGVFGLTNTPVTLPNKTNLPNIEDYRLPDEVKGILEHYDDKKIILYQGAFTADRYLDCFIDAILDFDSDEFVLFLMGRSNDYYEKLKEKYTHKKVVFLPFLTPPEHLLVTKNAYIGLLTYIAPNVEYHNVINTLYCAPNKIFEYSKFSIPMISNNLPSLNSMFLKHHAGIAVEEVTNEMIQKAILEIDGNYEHFSSESKKMYEYTDTKNILEKIITTLNG